MRHHVLLITLLLVSLLLGRLRILDSRWLLLCRCETLVSLTKLFSHIRRSSTLQGAGALIVIINHVVTWSKYPFEKLSVVQSIKLHRVVELTNLTRVDLLGIGEFLEELLPAFLEQGSVFTAAPSRLDLLGINTLWSTVCKTGRRGVAGRTLDGLQDEAW
jgi:hypothetical protein